MGSGLILHDSESIIPPFQYEVYSLVPELRGGYSTAYLCNYIPANEGLWSTTEVDFVIMPNAFLTGGVPVEAGNSRPDP